MGRLSSHPVSRRMFMKHTAALASVLAAYRATGAMAEGSALNILNSNTIWAEALTGGVAAEYKGAAITGKANPYEAHYEKMMIELSQGSSTFDLVTTDNLWIVQPMANGWAAALDDIVAAMAEAPKFMLENLAQASLGYQQYNGKRFGLPMVMTTPILAYRKDLLEAAGLEVPKTWDEYREAAAKLHSDEVAGNVLLLTLASSAGHLRVEAKTGTRC